MVTRVLCVAEKPSIAKAVAGHLAGGSFQTVSGNSKDMLSSDMSCRRTYQTLDLTRTTASSTISQHGVSAKSQ